MKIAIYTQDIDIINLFNRYTKNSSSGSSYKDSVILVREATEIITVRTEKAFFDLIADDSIDGFAISLPATFCKKSIDFIKRKSTYVPVLVFGELKDVVTIPGADIYLPFKELEDKEFSYRALFEIIISNISTYSRNFSKLRKLMTQMSDVIEFSTCSYDPTRRMLSYNGKEVKKLSAKEGGILEILSSNFGQVVKKEIILEKVWKKDDYFSGRSMDVYVTHLRRLFSEHDIKLNIKNISGVGLILE